jgi:hypothetical protein
MCTYKTTPNYFFSAVLLLGAMFFGYCSHAIWPVENDKKSIDYIVIYTLLSIFLFFLLGCIWAILETKIFCLTESELIIKKPLLFLKRNICFADVERILEKKEDINISRGVSYEPIYSSNVAILKLNNGKQIKIQAMQIKGYKLLLRGIKAKIGK